MASKPTDALRLELQFRLDEISSKRLSRFSVSMSATPAAAADSLSSGYSTAPPAPLDKRGDGGRAEQDRHSGMPLRPTLTTSAGLTRYNSFALAIFANGWVCESRSSDRKFSLWL
jgi:hypothetical protein